MEGFCFQSLLGSLEIESLQQRVLGLGLQSLRSQARIFLKKKKIGQWHPSVSKLYCVSPRSLLSYPSKRNYNAQFV